MNAVLLGESLVIKDLESLIFLVPFAELFPNSVTSYIAYASSAV